MSFEDFNDKYDKIVNWSARLSRDGPFLIDLLNEHNAVSILDAGCGTGRHAVYLAERGFDVTASDISLSMIRQAKELAASKKVKMDFIVSSFHDLADKARRTYDAILCIGNSLSLVMEQSELEGSISSFHRISVPGSLLVLHILNYEMLRRHNLRFSPLRVYSEGSSETLFLRFFDFGEDVVGLNLLTIFKDKNGKWKKDISSTNLNPINYSSLKELLEQVGYEILSVYGGLDGSEYRSESHDIVICAKSRV